MKNIPSKIYLNVGTGIEPTTDFKSLSEVTFCEDKIDADDIEYVLSTPSPITDEVIEGFAEAELPLIPTAHFFSRRVSMNDDIEKERTGYKKGFQKALSLQGEKHSKEVIAAFFDYAFNKSDFTWTGSTFDENTGHDDFNSFTPIELFEHYINLPSNPL